MMVMNLARVFSKKLWQYYLCILHFLWWCSDLLDTLLKILVLFREKIFHGQNPIYSWLISPSPVSWWNLLYTKTHIYLVDITVSCFLVKSFIHKISCNTRRLHTNKNSAWICIFYEQLVSKPQSSQLLVFSRFSGLKVA